LNDRENHDYCTKKFIDLANQLKNEGMDIKLVSAALMSASGIYTTYTAAGDTGALEPSGVEKVIDMYRMCLENIQDIKKSQASGGEQA